jgi:hypothetical protein
MVDIYLSVLECVKYKDAKKVMVSTTAESVTIPTQLISAETALKALISTMAPEFPT